VDRVRKDTRIGSYVMGVRYDYNDCKYKILIALNRWEDNPAYLQNTYFAKDLAKSIFDSEEEADYYFDIVFEKIADWENYKINKRK
jgi:hypothetical protein